MVLNSAAGNALVQLGSTVVTVLNSTQAKAVADAQKIKNQVKNSDRESVKKLNHLLIKACETFLAGNENKTSANLVKNEAERTQTAMVALVIGTIGESVIPLIGKAIVYMAASVTTLGVTEAIKDTVDMFLFERDEEGENEREQPQGEVSEEDNASETLDDILEDAKLGRKTKGKSQQWEKKGGYDDAVNDYNRLKPDNSQDIQTVYGNGKTGSLPDGSKINVRPGSSHGDATLEIQNLMEQE